MQGREGPEELSTVSLQAVYNGPLLGHREPPMSLEDSVPGLIGFISVSKDLC